MEHAGKKYLRKIYSPIDGSSIYVDVYAVLEAFRVTCPARGHAIKKLLCAGLRGKGSELQDLDEAINSCGPRILEMQRVREAVVAAPKTERCNSCNYERGIISTGKRCECGGRYEPVYEGQHPGGEEVEGEGGRVK